MENFAAMAYGVLASIAVGVIFGVVWGSVRMRQHTMATPLYKFSWKRFFLFGLTGAVVCLVAVFWSGAATAECRPDSALFATGSLCRSSGRIDRNRPISLSSGNRVYYRGQGIFWKC